MVKFRCQRCSQKIAVEHEGIGVVIACPTCADQLVVPPQSDREFIPHKADTVPLELVRDEPIVRSSSWLRIMVEKVLPALLLQRRELLQTQNEAAEQLAAFEQRIILLQMKLQRRMGFFQERVSTLERENRELLRKIQTLSEPAREPAATFGTGRVTLRDSGFLLRT